MTAHDNFRYSIRLQECGEKGAKVQIIRYICGYKLYIQLSDCTDTYSILIHSDSVRLKMLVLVHQIYYGLFFSNTN